MDKKDFLFEIGVEEIPAGYIANAVTGIKKYFVKRLREERLSFQEMKLYSTPRRFTLWVKQLETKQADISTERIGPAKTIAYDENGNLSKAALGFLRSANAEEKDIYFVKTPKGEKLAVKIEKKGKSAELILKDIIVEVIGKIDFPKTMRWGENKISFARPIRWLLVLLGTETIPVEISGIPAGKLSYGNRFQKLSNSVEINSPAEYEGRLKTVFVIPDREERKSLISEQIKKILKSGNEKVVEDEKLLEIVTDLVEFPTAVVAEFEKKYLKLPEKIIISTLSQHQKYFSVKNNTGELSNKFIFISNGNPIYSDIIKLGNEKVIKARLEDAEFFFEEDRKKPLEEYVPKLKEVTFQAKLGNLLEKTERIGRIAAVISDNLHLNKNEKNLINRASWLCKADLVTMMLGEKEFTKLQGYIGMKYAELDGEPAEVCQAIYEHYQPRGQNDELPKTLTGSIVAIADKMDTICGIIGVGLIPSGSNDPFALRRAGNGIVQIIDDKKLELDLTALIDETFNILNDKLEKPNNNKTKVYEFFRQRVYWLLKQSQIDYDVIESVMHIDYSDVYDLKRRAADVQKFKQREDFIKLVIGFKRVANIISEITNLNEVEEKLLREDSEKLLYHEFLKLNEIVSEFLPEKNYEKIMEHLVDFGKIIDKFFDDVLVNTENIALRKNRYNLLGKIRELFLKVADLSKIVVEGNFI
ncbi:MAG: glycine--tRNA ligase subunit beta [Candidatus Cloacimonas sp. 4484_275]|nr:MAG: glycine--tRNA ligase subunit beta [Candidatus Cloacimonas sp. 4484_275]